MATTTVFSVPFLDAHRRWIYACFLLLIVAVVPVWLQTCALYRAKLPYDEIARWSVENLAVNFRLPVTVHIAPQWRPSSELGISHAREQIQERVVEMFEEARAVAVVTEATAGSTGMESSGTNSGGTGLGALNYAVDVGVEWLVADKDQTAKKLQTLDDYRQMITSHAKKHTSDKQAIHYHVYVIPLDGKRKAAENNAVATISDERHIILQVSKDIDNNEFSALVGDLLASIFIDEYHGIQQQTSPSSGKQLEMDTLRAAKFAPGYQISLSLMNGDSERLDVEWAVKEAVEAFWKPLFAELAPMAEFHVTSQVQQFAALTLKPSLSEDGKSHVLPVGLLPHFINAAEWNLATATKYPELNFLLYIPPSTIRPLHLLTTSGTVSPTNGFAVPQWGGVVVYNPPVRNATVGKVFLRAEELRAVMETFLEQLRGVLGVEAVWRPTTEVHRGVEKTHRMTVTVATSATGITRWEMDRLLRRRTIENMANTAETLNALRRLLVQMQSIVVQDSIQEMVDGALHYLKETHAGISKASSATDLATTFLASKHAIHLAERAFFDPSMTAMVYFPIEHQYAVYAPLFFPVAVPLITYLLREIKAVRERKRGGKKL